MSKYNVKARQRARRLVVQALYQWQFNQISPKEIESQLTEKDSAQNIDANYFKELLHGVIKNIVSIDETLQPALSRPLEELTPIELAVLRMAIYELKNRKDIPYRVVINEALELTKSFGTNEGYKFVNGVLDRLASQLRSEEANEKQ